MCPRVLVQLFLRSDLTRLQGLKETNASSSPAHNLCCIKCSIRFHHNMRLLLVDSFDRIWLSRWQRHGTVWGDASNPLCMDFFCFQMLDFDGVLLTIEV